MKASNETIDVYNNNRIVGEEWLVREKGAYLPFVHEVFVEIIEGTILTDTLALHI